MKSNRKDKNKKAMAAETPVAETVVADTSSKKENKAITSFETFFYRFVAWFPILVLPSLVWEMMNSGDWIGATLIGLMHAILVFRFVQVIAPQKWFNRVKTS